jgi:DNA-binding LytR/AlgR family response regulator
MLRVVAVDDEPPALNELVYLLRADPRVDHVEGLSSTTEALRHIHRVLDTGEAPHAVFLDVHMPGLDGLDMARLLARFAHPPVIVFVTADVEPAVEAFELKAADYVLKPYRPERLAEAVRRVAESVGAATVAPSVPEPTVAPASAGANEKVPVQLGGVTSFISVSDIWYAEAHGDYARLFTGRGSHLVRTSLGTLEERWRDAGFVRIHRSHLVAYRYVEELRHDGGQMSVRIGEHVLPVSRRHARELRSMLLRRDGGLTVS